MSEAADAPRPIVVGVLSDTHGHLYPEVKEALKGVDHIIHAGDIGSKQVLASLRALAPVTAVRGNCDMEAWAASLPAEALVELEGVPILVKHIARGGSVGRSGATGIQGGAPSATVPRVVVTGHTHRPASEERGGVLYLNPGSAGPERFGRPRTMAKLLVQPPARPNEAAGVSVEFQVVSRS